MCQMIVSPLWSLSFMWTLEIGAIFTFVGVVSAFQSLWTAPEESAHCLKFGLNSFLHNNNPAQAQCLWWFRSSSEGKVMLNSWNRKRLLAGASDLVSCLVFIALFLASSYEIHFHGQKVRYIKSRPSHDLEETWSIYSKVPVHAPSRHHPESSLLIPGYRSKTLNIEKKNVRTKKSSHTPSNTQRISSSYL